MPLDKPGTLSAQQLADLIALLLKTGGFPSGTRALDPQTITAAPIKIMSEKP